MKRLLLSLALALASCSPVADEPMPAFYSDSNLELRCWDEGAWTRVCVLCGVTPDGARCARFEP